MNEVLEFFTTLFLVIYYWLEAIVLTFIPAGLRGKSVAGETVLVTGAGELTFKFFYFFFITSTGALSFFYFSLSVQ